MRNGVLIMKRKSMAQVLMSKIKEQGGWNIILEQNYNMAEKSAMEQNADTAVIEAAEDGQYNIVYCLNLCARFRMNLPECKILFLCPEQNKENISKAIAAKQNKIIDDFIFYDTSLEYLVSKVFSI